MRLHRVLVAVVLLAGAVLATSDAWLDIASIAERDPEASQVYLAPVVAAWLLWIRRGRLRRYAPEGTLVGPLLVLVGWVAYAFGDRMLLQSVWHLGALVVAVGCVVSALGCGIVTRLLPVYGALCFLVPVPGRVRQAIAVPLQSATAWVTEISLDTLGVPIERLGSVLRINDQEVLIAEACNGLRMVFALVIVSYAFAYSVPLRNGIRVLIVLASPLSAVVFNVVRLMPVVWSFGYLEPEVATVVHDVSAWIMLPMAFLALLGLTRVLQWAQVPVSPYILAHAS